MSEATTHQRNQFRHFWEELCAVSYDRLLKYGRTLAHGNVHDAEDLAQSTTYRVLLYAPDPTLIKNPFGYLLRTMRNVWRDQRATPNSHIIFSLDALVSDDQDGRYEGSLLRRSLPDAAALDRMNIMIDTSFLLNEILGGLEPKQQEFMRLLFQGNSYAEIGKRLGMSEVAARKSGQRLKQRLRRRSHS